MKKHDDPDYVVKIEQAIVKKYGKEAVQHPRANWDDEKEKDYIEQLKKLSEKEKQKSEKNEKVEKSGFLISKKLLKKRGQRKCPKCGVYSFDTKDDLYMNKHQCCWVCYVRYIEHDLEVPKLAKLLEENPDWEDTEKENENYENET